MPVIIIIVIKLFSIFLYFYLFNNFFPDHHEIFLVTIVFTLEHTFTYLLVVIVIIVMLLFIHL